MKAPVTCGTCGVLLRLPWAGRTAGRILTLLLPGLRGVRRLAGGRTARPVAGGPGSVLGRSWGGTGCPP